MTFEGTVESRNERGIKVNGEWLNVSKFHVIHDLPEVGETVRGEVDSKGFLKSISSLDAPWIPASSSELPRDERAIRLEVLKAAAHFAATRADIKSAQVLDIARIWLNWLEKDEPS